MSYKPTLMRTKAADADDSDPNTSAPSASEIFYVRKGKGYRASLDHAATGKVSTVTVWVKNETSNKWDNCGSIIGVGEHVMFGDPGSNSDLPDGAIWIQLTTNTAGAAPIAVYVDAC